MLPDWCTNRLTVRGPSAAVTRFTEAVSDPATGSPLSLERVAPTPEDVLVDGYAGDDEPLSEWRLAHWGTVSDVLPEDVQMTRDGSADRHDRTPFGVVRYDFLTEWDPPFEAVCQLTRLHRELAFELISYSEQIAYATCDRWDGGVYTHIHTDNPTDRIALLREHEWDEAAIQTEEELARHTRPWAPNPFFDGFIKAGAWESRYE